MRDPRRRAALRGFYALLLTGLVMVAAIWLHAWQQNRSGMARTPALEDVQALFPKAARTGTVGSPHGMIQVFDAEARWLGFVLATSPVCDAIRGYAGPTPLLIGLDRQGMVTGVHMLSNHESGDFAGKVRAQGLLTRWNGMHWKSAAACPVDTVASATMTSQCIIETIRHRLAGLEQDDFPLPAREKRMDYLAGLLAVAALFFAFFPFSYSRQARTILLVLSLVYLGLIRKSFLSMALLASWIRLGGEWPAGLALLGILILSVILAVLFGKPFYCHYLCPFGAAQELINRILPWTWRIPRTWHRHLIRMRTVLLAMIGILMLVDWGVDFSKFEPFTVFLLQAAGAWTLILAGLSLALSAFINRFWCTYFCPTGALLDQFRGRAQKPFADRTQSGPGH